MDRVKELREEKIKREKIAEIVEQQEEIRAELEYIKTEESKYVDWRRDLENLNETMTTAGMGMINLPATGDVDLVTTQQTFETSFNGSNESVSGGVVTLAGSSNTIVGGEHTIYRRAMFRVDGSKSTTLKLTIIKGGGTSSWTDRDPAQNFDDQVKINLYQASGPIDGPSYYNGNLTTGTHLIPLPGQFEDLQIQIEQFAKVSATGALRITGASLQRRTPVNVFVSLDDPGASAFVRDGDFDLLSNEEKKKKLEEMLKSSQEYLDKMFGEGMPKGATEVADYEPQQSFIDQLNPNIVGRGLRSVTDQARFGGDKMFQGNPKGRAPGLSNYWSPEPQTAATYSNPGAGKGIPGRGPDPTGTLTTTQRPPGTPRVTRGLTGTPQFKFPQGSPPPANMLTQMADDAAVAAAKKAAATKTGKLLGRAVPVAGAAIAVADASIRVNNGDYAGAVLSGLSAIPGPAGWAALGLQIATDAAGFTGGVKEQQEFDNYGDYIKGAAKIAKKNKIKIDRNAMLDLFLRELSKNNKLSDKDKEFLVAIFTDAEGLEKDDVISFVKKIQKKLMDGESIKEQIITEKKRLKSVKDIPGYYDGKPSPLGFPVEEPPKMKNGFHPDLVDGKKVANRFNRLDPTSAKAMPPTGNPHIDKKVRAAAKKPK
jgi:hypothetical protein